MPSNKIEQTVIAFLKENGIDTSGKKLLLALSGGPDSVFLFHLLLQLSPLLNFSFQAAHLNHSLRGKESDADMVFCLKLCEENRITLHTDVIDVKKYSSDNKLSIEEAAREARYGFLEGVADKINADYILTAHHKGDNAETIFYNIIKGSGISGAAGIPVKRGNILRPLLSLSREDIIESLHEDQIEYRTDSSNADNDFSRNFIRNELFPKIKENLNPSMEEALYRFGNILREANYYIEQKVVSAVEKYVSFEKDVVRISDDLSSEGEFLFGETIKKIIEEHFLEQFTYDDYLNLSLLSDNLTGKKNNLKNGLVAWKERNELIITRDFEIKDYRYEIFPGEEITVSEAGIKIRIELISDETPSFSHDYELISANNIDDMFILRNWNFGDKFIPLGMRGYKKISDFLNENKIESFRKNGMPVLINRNNIVSVVGLRIDDRYKITKTDKKFCKIWVKKDD
ncbi:MAG: tRNA(Ile)-lysidine synthase [Melioribacteraceae bacterium]|nr:MAG: tRNA(Ile)-lysidine synthase [Melioribacteraceae bacterium]